MFSVTPSQTPKATAITAAAAASTPGVTINGFQMQMPGCLICGTDTACQNVVAPTSQYLVPNGQVFVEPSCSAQYILSYMDFYYGFGSSNTCQDKNSNSICDVVEEYCANLPPQFDPNCRQEFYPPTSPGDSWTKTGKMAAMDPDVSSTSGTSSNGSHNGNKAAERWIGGSIAIVLLLIVMLGALLMMGQCKKSEGSETNQRRQQQQDVPTKIDCHIQPEEDDDDTHKSNSDRSNNYESDDEAPLEHV